MKRFVLAISMVLVSASAFAGHGSHTRGMNVSIDGDGDGDSCDDRRVRFGSQRAVMATEEVPVGGMRALKIRGDHAGVRVTRASGSSYRVVACKAAALASDLGQIRVGVRGSEVAADGPDSDWVVFYFVEMPRGGDLTIESENGPVSLNGIDGTVVARSTNGPLAVKDSHGRIDARTTNGPLAVTGGSGQLKLASSNGPLAVRLEGAQWQGGSLEASTTNGPLSVRLPRNYGSGVTVEANGHGPISCRAEGCVSRHGFDNDGDEESRTIELGSGARAVRLSTTNGPVTIKDE